MTFTTYDFIIIGGGTSGPVLANRLANTRTSASILLIEAGGTNDTSDVRHLDHRYSAAFNPELQALNWGYTSTPAPHLDGTVIDCSRGKGLGGSSSINFSAWLLGHEEDFNDWAKQVGDDCWKWNGPGGVKERFRKIENVHINPSQEYNEFLDYQSLKKNHSHSGNVDLTFAKSWNSWQRRAADACLEFGMPLNGDLNSGNPIGMGSAPTTWTGADGLRGTAATAYLQKQHVPKNLTILTDTMVTKILFDTSSRLPRARSVLTALGNIFHARQEVIVCCGSIDTPKLLKLSGIGPAEELESLNIPVVHDSPYVGENMRDHPNTGFTIQLKKSQPIEPRAFNSTMAWLESPAIKSSPEYHALDPHIKAHLDKLPSYELILSDRQVPGIPIPEGSAVVHFHTMLMNVQSNGTVMLSSADPMDAPLIDLNALSHPYDKRMGIEAVREALAYARTPVWAEVTEKLFGPADDSDEEIWKWWQKRVGSTWHFSGTCKMGVASDPEAVVDPSFRVYGVEGLRVVDMSICPLVPNNHVVSTAYLIGETAAEKMIREYALDERPLSRANL